MKRAWLTVICTALFLIMPVCMPATAEGIDERSPVYDTQIIFATHFTKDTYKYEGKLVDEERQAVLNLVADLAYMIPDGVHTVVLSNTSDLEQDEAEGAVQTVRNLYGMSLQESAADVSKIIEKIWTLTSQAEHNVLIVLDNITPDAKWKELRELCADGADVYFINVQTPNQQRERLKDLVEYLIGEDAEYQDSEGHAIAYERDAFVFQPDTEYVFPLTREEGSVLAEENSEPSGEDVITGQETSEPTTANSEQEEENPELVEVDSKLTQENTESSDEVSELTEENSEQIRETADVLEERPTGGAAIQNAAAIHLYSISDFYAFEENAGLLMSLSSALSGRKFTKAEAASIVISVSSVLTESIFLYLPGMTDIEGIVVTGEDGQTIAADDLEIIVPINYADDGLQAEEIIEQLETTEQEQADEVSEVQLAGESNDEQGVEQPTAEVGTLDELSEDADSPAFSDEPEDDKTDMNQMQTDESVTDPIANEVVDEEAPEYQLPYMLLRVNNGEGPLTVEAVDGLPILLGYFTQERQAPEARFEWLADQMAYDRNKMAEITVAAVGVDAEALRKDMEANGYQLFAVDEANNEILLEYQDGKWNGTVCIDNNKTFAIKMSKTNIYASGTDGAQAFLSSMENGSALEIHANNSAPVLTLDTDETEAQEWWINNPWNEGTDGELKIFQVRVSDTDGDKVDLSTGDAVSEGIHVSIKPLSEQDDETIPEATPAETLRDAGPTEQLYTVVVEPKEWVDEDENAKTSLETDKTYHIELIGYDGMSKSEPLSLDFVVYDTLTYLDAVHVNENQQLIFSENEKYKKTDITVSVPLTIEAGRLSERVAQMIREHYSIMLLVTKPDQETVSYVMELQEQGSVDSQGNMIYQAETSISLDDAGEYGMQIVFKGYEGMQGLMDVPASPEKVDILNHAPVQRENPDYQWDDAGEMTSFDTDPDEQWVMAPFSANDLFVDADNDTITITVAVKDENQKTLALLEQRDGEWLVDGEGVYSGGPARASGDETVSLIFEKKGNYTLTITATDGESESAEADRIEHGITVTSERDRLAAEAAEARLRRLIIAGLVVLTLAIVAGLIQLLRPGYKGKTIHVAVQYRDGWKQETTVSLGNWGKATIPIWQVLTCAACPPEAEIYNAFENVQMKPSRQGIMLTNAKALAGDSNTVRLEENDAWTVQIHDYQVSLSQKNAAE